MDTYEAFDTLLEHFQNNLTLTEISHMDPPATAAEGFEPV